MDFQEFLDKKLTVGEISLLCLRQLLLNQQAMLSAQNGYKSQRHNETTKLITKLEKFLQEGK